MELWDIYDIDRQKTGKLCQRVDGKALADQDYHLVVHICLFNPQGQLLIQRRQLDKAGYPGLWDVTAAGSALAGETSAQAAARELFEEMGIRHDFTNERPAFTVDFPTALTTSTSSKRPTSPCPTFACKRRRYWMQTGRPCRRFCSCSRRSDSSPTIRSLYSCGLP